jgi:hypothetical protein
MHKATEQQQQELITTTLKALAEYVDFAQFSNSTDEQFSAANVEQFTQDIAYMCKAVEQFAKTANLEQFNNAVYTQDTFVREYYINTIYAIEDCAVEA